MQFLIPVPRHTLRPHARRRGITAVEVIVAFTLLSGLLSVAASLIVTHGRMVTAQRHYRLALDELTNQMEHLTSLDASELPAALEALEPSALTSESLKGVHLEGEATPTEAGQQIVLRIWWDEPQRREAPVRLVGWVVGDADTSAPASKEDPS